MKTAYKLKANNKIIDIYVVETVGWSITNTIVNYENVGGDGGFAFSTGRVTQEIPITFTTLSNFDDNLKLLSKLKKIKEPIELFDSINTYKLFGKYLIKSIDTNITGDSDSMTINMTLTEYRNVNVSTKQYNVLTNKSAENVVQYLRNYNQLIEQ